MTETKQLDLTYITDYLNSHKSPETIDDLKEMFSGFFGYKNTLDIGICGIAQIYDQKPQLNITYGPFRKGFSIFKEGEKSCCLVEYPSAPSRPWITKSTESRVVSNFITELEMALKINNRHNELKE